MGALTPDEDAEVDSVADAVDDEEEDLVSFVLVGSVGVVEGAAIECKPEIVTTVSVPIMCSTSVLR